MSETYYLRQQTQISGPYTTEQIKSLLHRGRVARSDKISTDRQNWIQVADCPNVTHRPAAVQPAAAAEAPVSDGLEWFYTLGGAEQPTAVSKQAITGLIAAGSLTADDMVWRNGFDTWMPLSSVPEFTTALAAAVPGMPDLPMPSVMPPSSVPGPVVTPGGDPDFQAFVGKKLAAGLLALLIGPLGIHKFILGLTTGGVSMLLLCLLLIPIPFLCVAAFVEGVLYLTKSDDDFYRDYAINKKQWF